MCCSPIPPVRASKAPPAKTTKPFAPILLFFFRTDAQLVPELRRISRLVLLACAADGNGVGGNVLGDRRAGCYVGTVADGNGRDELRVRADEHTPAHDRSVFSEPIV